MPTHITEIFFYDDIYFENGRKDTNEHPVVIAGSDNENIYCFTMTSKTKHTEKNGYSRNIYNQNIKYVQTKPGINCHTNNSIEGLINTTNCITIPKTKAQNYQPFGLISNKLLEDIILRWAYQQNEVNDQKDDTYQEKSQALGINDSITMTPLYRQLVHLMDDHQEELQNQRVYAKELRKYREECTKIRRENMHNHYLGLKPQKYPEEPKLPYDKAYLELYSSPQISDEERIKNSPFAGLSEQLFGSSTTETKVVDTTISEQKSKLIELKTMLQEHPNIEEKEEATQHKKAA